jgi:hypothetical protein
MILLVPPDKYHDTISKWATNTYFLFLPETKFISNITDQSEF